MAKGHAKRTQPTPGIFVRAAGSAVRWREFLFRSSPEEFAPGFFAPERLAELEAHPRLVVRRKTLTAAEGYVP